MPRDNMLPKICFLDMEGTLLKKEHSLDNGKVAPSAWTVLAREIGPECYVEEELSKDKWLRGDYVSYTSWMHDTICIHKKHGLTEKIFNKVISASNLQNGAEELVKYLNDKKIITVIISGGFKALADKVQRKLKIVHSYSACEYFFDENGEFEHFNLLPTDERGKVVFMQHLAEEYKVSLQDCVFIGDGKNDVHLAMAAGYSISFNGQPELESVSDYAVQQPNTEEDLSALIEVIEKLN